MAATIINTQPLSAPVYHHFIWAERISSGQERNRQIFLERKIDQVTLWFQPIYTTSFQLQSNKIRFGFKNFGKMTLKISYILRAKNTLSEHPMSYHISIIQIDLSFRQHQKFIKNPTRWQRIIKRNILQRSIDQNILSIDPKRNIITGATRLRFRRELVIIFKYR